MKRCSHCKIYKSPEAFHRDKNRPDGRYPTCKKCVSIKTANRYRKAEYPTPPSFKKCPSCKKTKSSQEFYRYKRRKDGLMRMCKQCTDIDHRNWKVQLRQEALDAYDNKCACCGENHPEFLSIDHINGGGTKHREKMGQSYSIYLYLKKRGYPKDEYQLLCHNCNQAKGIYGYCPHEKERDLL